MYSQITSALKLLYFSVVAKEAVVAAAVEVEAVVATAVVVAAVTVVEETTVAIARTATMAAVAGEADTVVARPRLTTEVAEAGAGGTTAPGQGPTRHVSTSSIIPVSRFPQGLFFWHNSSRQPHRTSILRILRPVAIFAN